MNVVGSKWEEAGDLFCVHYYQEIHSSPTTQLHWEIPTSSLYTIHSISYMQVPVGPAFWVGCHIKNLVVNIRKIYHRFIALVAFVLWDA